MAMGGTRLQYLDANPVTQGWDYRTKVREQQEAHELEMSAREAALAETMASAPLRVGQQRAQTRLSTTNADVAEQTAPYKVTQERTQAEQGEFNLGRDKEFLPYEVRSKAAGADYDEANAAAASNAEEAAAWKEEKFLRLAGEDPEGAEIWAGQVGLDVPPEMRQLIRDRKFMALSKGTMDAIESVYGTGDENLVTRYTEYNRIMQGLMGQTDGPGAGPGSEEAPPVQEQPIPSVADAYKMMSTTDSTEPVDPNVVGGKGSGNAVYDRKYATWLKIYRDAGLPDAEKRAAEMASGVKHFTVAQLKIEARKAAQSLVSGSFGSIKQKAEEFDRRYKEFYADLLEAEGLTDDGELVGGTSEIDQPQGDAPETGTFAGSGTQDDPYTPQTEQDLDSMKPGDIYIDPGDGKAYRFNG
jgi:hypothetical protein